MSDPRPAGGASRRQLLGGALGGLATATVGAPAVALSRTTPVAAGGDRRQLAGLLGVERRVTGTYRRVLAAGVLNVVVAAEVSGFQAQEREHIGALERQLLLRGQRPQPEAPVPGGALVESQADALTMLLGAERAAETAYLGAMAKLQDPGLVRLAAEIMASEAQHWSLLRVLLSPQDLPGAVPGPFVTGSS